MVTQQSTCLRLSDNMASAITWWRRLPEKFCRNPIMFSFFYDGFPADSASVVSILFSSLNAKRGTLTITLLMNSSCLAAATLYLSGQGHVSALQGVRDVISVHALFSFSLCESTRAKPSITAFFLHANSVNQHDNRKAETIACFTQEVICRELPQMIDRVAIFLSSTLSQEKK